MSQHGELQGLLNVKIPSRTRTRRFIPWKTWKRQWVVLRQSTTSENGLELLIGRGSQNMMHISADDVVIRTESRTNQFAFGVFPSLSKRRANFYLAGSSETESQKWISTIRTFLHPPTMQVEEGEFSVTVIDNMFSRSAGLAGTFGILRVSTEHVDILNPATCSTCVQWSWNTLAQFHVSTGLAPEDEGHICSILTTSKFCAGVGRIHLYCADAVTLTQRLITKGRPSSLVPSPVLRVSTPYRHYTFSFKFPERGSKNIKPAPSSPLLFPHGTLRKLSTASRSLQLGRRLSRSEGNLRAIFDQMDDSRGRGSLERNCPESASPDGSSHDSGEKTSLSSDDSSILKGKIATSLISAGFGLMLTTPGCSECDSESAHEYQKVGDDSDEELCGLSFIASHRYSPPRRESGVSVASGVYEEIDDISIHLDMTGLESVAEMEAEEPPPPLPPRRGLFVKSVSEDLADCGYTNMLQIPRTPNLFTSRSAGNTPLPSPPSLSRSHTAPPSAQDIIPYVKADWRPRLQEADYLPMSPGRGFLQDAIEEQHYMVMASVNIT